MNFCPRHRRSNLQRCRDRGEFRLDRTPFGRCTRRHERWKLTMLLAAEITPSGLATSPTDPMVFRRRFFNFSGIIARS